MIIVQNDGMKKQNKNRVQRKAKKRKPSKRKVNIRKPIEERLEFRVLSNDKGEVNVTIDDDGRIYFEEEIEGHTKNTISYERNSGKRKTVSGVTFNGIGGYLNQTEYLQKEFDVIAGIDTNNFSHEGKILSIASSFYSRTVIAPEVSTVSIGLLPSFIISDVNPSLNPEVIGWHLFFKHILPLLGLSNKKLGLVVDSELDKHQLINSRSIPYYADQYLQENIQLIYASEKGGNLPNKIIRACDKASRDLKKIILNGELKIPDQLGSGTNDFSGYAYVNYHNTDIMIS